MSDEPNNQAGGNGGAVKSAAGGAGQSQSTNVEEIVNSVVDKLTPLLSQQVTGAVKRQVASQLDGLDPEALKGLIAGASKSGGKSSSDPDGKTLTPEQVQVADLTRRMEEMTKQAQSLKARAVRGAVSAEIAKHNPTTGAMELLVDRFSQLVKEEPESGNLFVGDAENAQPLGQHLTDFFKNRPDLVKSDARSGSGAGSSTGTWQGDKPKSKMELQYRISKDSGGRVIERIPTPERRTEFIKAFGQEAFDRLP